MNLSRSGTDPVTLIRAVRQGYNTIKQEKPDLVHCIALRMVVLAGLSARLAGARAIILAPTGLGHAWADRGIAARSLRQIMRLVVGRLLRGSRTHYVFENTDDPSEFRLQPTAGNVTIVPGAGVAADDFPAMPEPPSPPVRIAVVSRMLRSKGIAEAVEAVCLARDRGVPVELDIYGAPDPENPSSIPTTTLMQWSERPGIAWRGPTGEVAAVWRDHHMALFLSSYREGVPRTLIEAAACGRAIITTDAVGCRDIVRDGEEGLLVPVGDIDAAANAIERLARDGALRSRLGSNANRRFRERFTEEAVQRAIGSVYSSIKAKLSQESQYAK